MRGVGGGGGGGGEGGVGRGTIRENRTEAVNIKHLAPLKYLICWMDRDDCKIFGIIMSMVECVNFIARVLQG